MQRALAKGPCADRQASTCHESDRLERLASTLLVNKAQENEKCLHDGLGVHDPVHVHETRCKVA